MKENNEKKGLRMNIRLKILLGVSVVLAILPFSYTHLDVYKRQAQYPPTELPIPPAAAIAEYP